MQERTFQFGLAILRLASSLPKTKETEAIVRQTVRSATSVGANYRSACRAKSKADFVFKLSISEQEADETIYWLEVLIGSGYLTQSSVAGLVKEGHELLAILTSSGRTARTSIRNSHSAIRNGPRG